VKVLAPPECFSNQVKRGADDPIGNNIRRAVARRVGC